ncbi:MAG: hypothetical protein COA79_13715 [Planctomycetota bacterium]|nr:MAG: hypothetical protein COA79_13715 [Planctomycetota bacterium]
MGSAALLFLSGSMAGKGSKLKEDLIILGRSSSCDITVKDNSISREHVKIFKEDDIYVLEDLNSNNGVKYEGEKIIRLELHTGMKFFIGKVEVQFIDPDQAPMLDAPVAGEVGAVSPDGEYSLAASGGDMSDDFAKIHALKMKRITNIAILVGIILALGILGALLVMFLGAKERPVHVQSLKMYTNEVKVVDLEFQPLGQAEKLLGPFVVHDYEEMLVSFDTLIEDKDFVIAENIKKPLINNALKIQTKYKTGSGSITFYIIKDEERKIIGVLNIDILRRPIPDIVNEYASASIAEKKKAANDTLIDYNKNKDNSEKLSENWRNLRDAKSIFIGGTDAKPDIYFKIEKEYYELTKIIERKTRQLFKKYAIAGSANDFREMRSVLKSIVSINPDDENLFRQKARIYIRRISLILSK